MAFLTRWSNKEICLPAKLDVDSMGSLQSKPMGSFRTPFGKKNQIIMRNRCVRHPTQISVIFYHFYDPDFPTHCGGHHHHDQHRCLDRKIIATLGMEENRTKKKNSERKNYTLTHTVGLGVSDSQASRSVERGHQIVPNESLKWPTNAGKTKQTARAACARHSLIEFIVHTNFGNWTIFFSGWFVPFGEQQSHPTWDDDFLKNNGLVFA